MPVQDRPNPSFLVLRIPVRDDVAKVQDSIAAQVSQEEGPALTWLGADSYALCRTVAKILGRGRTAAECEAWLKGLTEVADVVRTSADQAGAAYVARSAGTPAAGAETTSQNEWNLKMVAARAAWDLLPGGLPAAIWKKYRIGHIDTGYTEHDVFGPWSDHESPSLLPEAGINYVDPGPGSSPLDTLDYAGQPGHGTRTCSVLAGYAPGKFLGVAPQATVVPYRLTNSVIIDAFGNDVRLDRAIAHAVFDAGCRVISISLGDPCLPSRHVGRQVDRAYDEGVIIVAAAGNVTSEVTYPGRYARTICVGGVTRRRKPWSGGSRGLRVDVSAPAADVSRATSALDGGRPSYGYGDDGDGTSYATVHVAAAAVLWLAKHGPALRRYPEGWQIVEAFRWLVRRTAQRPSDWNDALFGAGILDIAALLAAQLPEPASLRRQNIEAAGESV